MLYFLGWILFMVGVVLSVPVAAMIEKSRRAPKPVPEPEPEIEEEPIEMVVAEEPVAEPEDELAKKLRRLRLISEGMTQEEMFAHAQATLELATMLQEKGQINEAGQALDILVNQPGIGDEYLIRSLAKHAVVFQQVGDEARVSESVQELRVAISRDPIALETAREDLTDEESALIDSLA